MDTVLKEKNFSNKNSGFNRQKWEILFSESQNKIFNISSFINSFLEQTEAFYEITRFELLFAFQEEEISCHLSYNAKKAVEELYLKEKKRWIELLLTSTTEVAKQQLIQEFASRESDFIKSYVQILDDCFIGNETFANNFSILKWRIIFEVFIGSQKVQFNRQHFVQYSLQKIAAHYGLSLQEILKYCMENFKLNQAKEAQEIIHIITELAQKNTKKVICLPQEEFDFPINLKEQLKVSGKKEETLLEKLQQQTKYIEYIQNIFGIVFQLRNFIIGELKLTFDNLKLLQIFGDLSKSYVTLSQAEILERMLKSISLQLPEKHKQPFWNKLIELSRDNKLLMQIIKRQNSFADNSKIKNEDNQECQVIIKEELKPKKMEEMMNKQTEPIFVNNAGMVLVSPFFQRLFSMLELTERSQFKNKEAQIKAIYLLQYAVFRKTDFPEYKLALNKILTGLDIPGAVPQNVELSQHEKETVESMLNSIVQHWDKLKNTSAATLREAFLQREGKLEENEDSYIITVEEKAYDMLLDSAPWGFRTIKFPWMEKRMEVKWR